MRYGLYYYSYRYYSPPFQRWISPDPLGSQNLYDALEDDLGNKAVLFGIDGYWIRRSDKGYYVAHMMPLPHCYTGVAYPKKNHVVVFEFLPSGDPVTISSETVPLQKHHLPYWLYLRTYESWRDI